MANDPITVNVDFDKLFNAIKKKVNSNLSIAANMVKKDAKQLCPYDPKSKHAKGLTEYPKTHNRNSLRHKVNKKKSVAYIFTTSGRGGWIEYGSAASSKRPWDVKEHPYIRPAMAKNKDKIIRLFENMLNDDLFFNALGIKND